MLKFGYAAAFLALAQANPYYKNEAYEKAHPRSGRKVSRREDPSKPLHVHVVPHSHDDVGWLKTIDEYYSGTNQESQHVMVSLILDSVIEELLKNPKRKFTYVEMKFFTMWYWRQSEETRNNVKMLVREGRLEFSNVAATKLRRKIRYLQMCRIFCLSYP